MQEKLLFVDLTSNHFRVVMTHWTENLQEHVVCMLSFLSLILQAILKVVVLGSFFIVFLFIDKIIFTGFSI